MLDSLRKKDARNLDAEGIEDDLKVIEDTKKMDNFCNKDTRYSDARLYVDKEITEQYGDAEVTENAWNFYVFNKKVARDFNAEVKRDDLEDSEDASKFDNLCKKDAAIWMKAAM